VTCKFNDDFGALALLATYHATGNEKYLKAVESYMNWVLAVQQPSGGFGKYSHAVSSCVAALNFLNLFLITDNEQYKVAATKAIVHLEESVVIDPENPVIHGGIKGMNVCDVVDDILSLRVTMYAMYLYLLAGIIDSGQLTELPEHVRNNPMFIGLRIMNHKKLF
jgi:hypothetical protein